MNFKSAKSFAEGLRLWRQRVLKNIPINKLAERNKKYSKSGDPYRGGQQFGRFERAEVFPTLDRLIEDVFPAYGIESLDQFILEFCPPQLRGLSEVQHLRAGEEIVREKRYEGTTRYGVNDLGFLGRIPVRVDHFVVPAGQRSEAIRHSGYNYLLVIKGPVCCHLAEEDHEGVEMSPAKAYPLRTGDALLFPTTLWHSIEAPEGEAEFIVAAPSWAHGVIERRSKGESP